MKKVFLIISLGALIVSGMLQPVFAGLIDYERRDRRLQGRTVESIPEWRESEPEVKNNLERRYDTNRDRKLQSAEVKILLRDVVDEVKAKGKYSVYSSDILKEYDKNKDRVIDAKEVESILKDVR